MLVSVVVLFTETVDMFRSSAIAGDVINPIKEAAITQRENSFRFISIK
jgi:hypothetical protein